MLDKFTILPAGDFSNKGMQAWVTAIKPKHVGIKGLAPGVELLLRHLLRAVLNPNARVVDQNIQAPVLGAHRLDGGGNAGRVIHIQGQSLDRQSLTLELACRCRALGAVAGGENDVHAFPGKLSNSFEADSLIGAGDESDLGHEVLQVVTVILSKPSHRAFC